MVTLNGNYFFFFGYKLGQGSIDYIILSLLITSNTLAGGSETIKFSNGYKDYDTTSLNSPHYNYKSKERK